MSPPENSDTLIGLRAGARPALEDCFAAVNSSAARITGDTLAMGDLRAAILALRQAVGHVIDHIDPGGGS